MSDARPATDAEVALWGAEACTIPRYGEITEAQHILYGMMDRLVARIAADAARIRALEEALEHMIKEARRTRDKCHGLGWTTYDLDEAARMASAALDPTPQSPHIETTHAAPAARDE